jgi:hypothetical protein
VKEQSKNVWGEPKIFKNVATFVGVRKQCYAVNVGDLIDNKSQEVFKP